MRHIDIFGHVHNSVYLDYCQDAVVDFLRANKIYSHFSHKEAPVPYLVKKVEVTFLHPLQVEDAVGAQVHIARLGRSSVTFEIRLARAEDNRDCAIGQIVWVCVDRDTGLSQQLPAGARAGLESLSI